MIKELRSEFINQCKNGIWKKNRWDDFYANQYFKFYIKDWKIEIKNIENSEIKISELKISKLKMIFLFFFIKKSVRNKEKNIRKEKVQNITQEFFIKNKDLRRENRINEIIK
jgi:hypothetical protein